MHSLVLLQEVLLATYPSQSGCQSGLEFTDVHLQELSLQSLGLESRSLSLEETVEQLVITDAFQDIDEFTLCQVIVELDHQP